MAAIVAVSGADARTPIRMVQLDTDAALESLRIERGSTRDCRGPEPCSRLALDDGTRTVALSTFRQRGRPSTYLWSIEHLRVLDLTGDGPREVFWNQETTGGTGSSPRLFAVDRWDGHRAKRIFTLTGSTRGAGGFAYSLPYDVKVAREPGGVRELATTEALYSSDRPGCCPNALRHRRYRWNGRRIALVAGSSRLTPASSP
jgi:hypothetical protein